jgi:hypothetical protein
MDIITAIKKEAEKQIANLHDLTGKLSGQLKSLSHLVPEKTRKKTVEAFLDDIRKGVFGEAAPRKRRKKAGAPRTARKTKKTVAKKRGRKKKVEAQPAAEKKAVTG